MKKTVILAITLLLFGCGENNKTAECGMNSDSTTAVNSELCSENITFRMLYNSHPASADGIVQRSSKDRSSSYISSVKENAEQAKVLEATAAVQAVSTAPLYSTIYLLSALFFAYTIYVYLFNRFMMPEKDEQNRFRYSVFWFAIMTTVFYMMLSTRYIFKDNVTLLGYAVGQLILTGEKFAQPIQRHTLNLITKGTATTDETSDTSASYAIAKDFVFKSFQIVVSAKQTDAQIIFATNKELVERGKSSFKATSFPISELVHQKDSSIEFYRESKLNSGSKWYNLGTLQLDKPGFQVNAALAEKADWTSYTTDDAGAFGAQLQGFADRLFTLTDSDKTINNETVKTLVHQLALINRNRVLTRFITETLPELESSYTAIQELACYDAVDAGNLSARYLSYLNGGKFDGHPLCLSDVGGSLKVLGKTAEANYEYQSTSIENRKQNLEQVKSNLKALIERFNAIEVTMNKGLLEALQTKRGRSAIKLAAKEGTGGFVTRFLDIQSTNDYTQRLMSQFSSSYNFTIENTDSAMLNEGFISKPSIKGYVLSYLNLKQYVTQVGQALAVDSRYVPKDSQALTPQLIEEHFATSSSSGAAMGMIEHAIRSPMTVFLNAMGVRGGCLERYEACKAPQSLPIRNLAALGQGLIANGSALYTGSVIAAITAKLASGSSAKAAAGIAAKKTKKLAAGTAVAVVLGVVAPLIFLVILAGVILAYLVPLMITVSAFMSYIYYQVFAMSLMGLVVLVLLRCVMPSDAGNRRSLAWKLLKLSIYVAIYPTVLTLTVIMTSLITNNVITAYAWISYTSLPQGESGFSGVIATAIGYFLLAYGLLAIIAVSIYAASQATATLLAYLGIEEIYAQQTLGLVRSVEFLFFKLIPGMKAMNMFFTGIRRDIDRKRKLSRRD